MSAELLRRYLQDRVRPRVEGFYIRPTLLALAASEDESDRLERLALDELLAQLLPVDGEPPRSWLVTGAPGAGKTTLLNQIELALLERGQPCVRITASSLAHLAGRAIASPYDLVKELRPNEVVEERWWKSRARHGDIVVLLDGLNEIERAHGDSEVGRLARDLLVGNHKFTVLATSRDAPDIVEDAPRLPRRLILPAFSEEQIADYLKHHGLDVAAARRAISAAGLEGLVANPWLLSLAVGLLREGLHDLPRTRAGLFEKTLVHAERRLAGREREALRRGPGLHAALAAVALCRLLVRPHDVKRQDIADALKRVWPADASEIIVEVLADKHLAVRCTEGGEPALRLLHESLVDFGVALLWRPASR